MMGMYPWPAPTSPSVMPAPATPPPVPPITGILPCTCIASIPGCAHHGTTGSWLPELTAASKALTRSLPSTCTPAAVRSTPSDAYGPEDVSRQPASAADIHAEIQRRCDELRTWSWHPDPDLAGKRAFRVAVANVLELLCDEARWT